MTAISKKMVEFNKRKVAALRKMASFYPMAIYEFTPIVTHIRLL